jgi:hypothetical protein
MIVSKGGLTMLCPVRNVGDGVGSGRWLGAPTSNLLTAIG